MYLSRLATPPVIPPAFLPVLSVVQSRQASRTAAHGGHRSHGLLLPLVWLTAHHVPADTVKKVFARHLVEVLHALQRQRHAGRGKLQQQSGCCGPREPGWPAGLLLPECQHWHRALCWTTHRAFGTPLAAAALIHSMMDGAHYYFTTLSAALTCRLALQGLCPCCPCHGRPWASCGCRQSQRQACGGYSSRHPQRLPCCASQGHAHRTGMSGACMSMQARARPQFLTQLLICTRNARAGSSCRILTPLSSTARQPTSQEDKDARIQWI